MFTTRPDTLFGATYLVLAPEHDLVDDLVADTWPDGTDPHWTYGAATPGEAVAAYRRESARSRIWNVRRARRRPASSWAATRLTRPTVNRYRSSLPTTCCSATVPARSWRSPATTSGTGTSLVQFGLPVVEVIAGGDISEAAYTGDGVLVNSGYLDGMNVAAAKEVITARLESDGRGRARIEYKLRDWLFRRQRYWGEPFPIVYDATGARTRSTKPHCRSSCPTCRTTRRCCSTRTTPTASRHRRWPRQPNGCTWSWTWATASSPTPATPTSCRMGRQFLV